MSHVALRPGILSTKFNHWGSQLDCGLETI